MGFETDKKVINWIVDKIKESDYVDEAVNKDLTPQEVNDSFIREYVKEFAKGKKANNKFISIIDGLDTADYVNELRLKQRVGRRVGFEEKKEARLSDLRNVGDAEGLRGYGLSPSRATYKTLMSRFDVEESVAREEAGRLGL